MKVDEVKMACGHVLNGRIILYPTDTVWGIGCDATDPLAVEMVFGIKQRADNKQMLVLMDGEAMLSRYLRKVPEEALPLIRTEGKPTTIIFPDAQNLADNLVGEDGSIGIRIPSDPFCLDLIMCTGKPIVSTSANISGRPTPSRFREIDPLIRKKVDYVVNVRQDEESPAVPSRIIRLDPEGGFVELRP